MLRGTLDEFSLPDVLRLISFARKTGVLDIARKEGRGRFFFREGGVYYAESSTEAPSVAERLVDSGAVSDEEVDDALSLSEASGRPVSDILIETGRVLAGALQDAALQQIHDASFDLMRWGEGEFSWQQVPEARPEVPVSLSVDDLIIEVARRLDEIAVQERKVVDEHSVLHLSPAFASAAAPITISPEQWRILALLDGRRSATEVASSAGIAIVEALRDLYHLVSRGVVETVVPEPEPEPQPEPAPVPKPVAKRPRKKPVPPAPPRRRTAPEGAPVAEEPFPQPVGDFALFQKVAIASAQEVTPDPVEAFDSPGPDEMTTRVPPPPPPAPRSSRPEPAAVPVAPNVPRREVVKELADLGTEGTEEVDPALIARLIQGVKEL